MSKINIISIGDLYIDFISDLTSNEYTNLLSNLDSSVNIFTDIKMNVGGTAVQLAEHALEVGFNNSTIIGKVGGQKDTNNNINPDYFGSIIQKYLKKKNIRHHLAYDFNIGTGRIIINYFYPNKRLMLANCLANATFSVDDICEDMIDSIINSQIVFVSGYTLLQKKRRDAIFKLLTIAKKNKVIVAFDTVPHDIYKMLSFNTIYREFGKLIDCIFIEIPTAHQLAGFGKLLANDQNSINEVINFYISKFSTVVLFLEPCKAIVYENSNCSEFLFNYTPGIYSRGQSAKAQAELLFKIINK
jgi:sugar/nucleoside kinase (ribokinase family)